MPQVAQVQMDQLENQAALGKVADLLAPLGYLVQLDRLKVHEVLMGLQVKEDEQVHQVLLALWE